MNSPFSLLSMRGWPQRRDQISSQAGVMHGVKIMTDSVYKVIELVGTSSKSWEDAARVAVERAAQTLRDLRIAEVVQQDLVVTDGRVEAYRSKLKLSFKYEGHG
jgi:flavin-binding protein dodecin